VISRRIGRHEPTRFLRAHRGHADEVFRVIAFLAIGSLVASLNLLLVWLLSRQRLLPYVLYVAVATECSILCSFVLNDRVTFRLLSRNGRRWGVRLLRFHGAAAIGALFTIGLSTVVYRLAHLPPVAAQFTAIVGATGLNFAMHRFWTYRRPKMHRAIRLPGDDMATLAAGRGDIAAPAE
jgi:putative flippase GtrA